MASKYMEETEWVVQITNELNSNESSTILEKEKWEKHSIYKIPACVTDLNKGAYKPQAVSFGPYHYGKEHLMAMEEHKHRALLHFLKRCGTPIEFLFKTMAQVEQALRRSYKPLDWKQGNDGFLWLMILDGCFMLEILRTADGVPGDYAINDPVFSDHGRLYIVPYIKRDMLMLENQLPMMVLDKLIEFEGNKTQDEDFLNKLILKFLSPITPMIQSFGKCLHILDIYRKSLLQNGPSHRTIMPKPTNPDGHGGDQIMRSARELHEAGIRFRRSKSQSLRDVSFNGGVLRLPSIVVDDCTESMFLNLIAFERLHVGAGNEVSSYVFFMDNIIDNEMDAAILHARGILFNALGSDKAVAKLFNSLSRDLAVDREGALDVVQVSVYRYFKKPWNRWRANLIETYFRNPWSFVSLIAAIFLFAFTIIQTVYTIIPFYMQDSSVPPPPPMTFTPRFSPPRHLI